MDVQSYINEMKEIQDIIHIYIDKDEEKEEEDTSEANYQNVLQIIDKYSQDKYMLKSILYLISKIANNHHRSSNFLIKIERIILYLKENIKQTYSNSEIFNTFRKNKRILLFLFENQILIMDEYIKRTIVNGKYKTAKYPQYFQPELELFDGKEKTSEKDFYHNRKIGENESIICQMIRDDSIDEFIIYVNKNLFPINKTVIEPSIFETNQFLLKKETNLIEYSAFFGSIQIFNYLRMNNVELTRSLWSYAIHGQNPEIIHILEENKIEPYDTTYINCLRESIKCHHNHFAEYFINNYINDNNIFYTYERNGVAMDCFHYYNFSFFPNDQVYLFKYACKYDYYIIVKNLMNTKTKSINEKIIKIIFFI